MSKFIEDRKITKQDLNQIEKYADRLFAKVGVDIEFTKHFLDRVNDVRNRKQITVSELIRLFKQTFRKYGVVIPTLGANAQAVLKDMQTDINVPFVLNVSRGGELELVNKTVMRKKNFRTSNPELRIERELTDKEKEEKENIVLKLKKQKSDFMKRYGKDWKSAMYGVATKIAKQKSIKEESLEESEAEYQGRKVTLNKPFRTPGESKKFGVYAKNDKGNVVLVRFGDPDMEINRDDDERRKSFRARHGCDDNPGPKWKAKYWSCRMWEKGKSVTDILKETRVKQDSDIKDREGTQPAKYYAKDASGDEMSKSTKKARARHFEKGAKKSDDDPSAYKPAPGDARANTKPSKYTKKMRQKFPELYEDADTSLKKKSKSSGISFDILKQVYNRGVAAWRTGHRPGTTPEQWGHARVNSFITGGKTRSTADADLWKKHKS
jgi:hypothetical protein